MSENKGCLIGILIIVVPFALWYYFVHIPEMELEEVKKLKEQSYDYSQKAKPPIMAIIIRAIPAARLTTYNPRRLILPLKQLTITTKSVHQKQAPNIIKTIPQRLCKKVVSSVIQPNLAKRAIYKNMTNGFVIVNPKEVRKS